MSNEFRGTQWTIDIIFMERRKAQRKGEKAMVTA